MMIALAQRIAWIKGKIILNLFFRVRVEGREHLEELKPPCLLVSNHRTYLDHFFVLSALPWHSPLIPIRAMALDGLYRHVILNFFLNLLGAFPAHKGEGFDVSLAKPIALLKEGFAVYIYPEGKRVHDTLFGEPRRGAALLALRAGVPLVPIAIVAFEGGMKLRDWFTRASVIVRFGKPFFLKENDPWKSTEYIMDQIKSLYYL